MKKHIAILASAVVLAGCTLSPAHNYKPSIGYVPDAKTAIDIAVAIWTPIYGKNEIEEEKPYKADLRNGIWYVSGSLPDGWRGGVAGAEIRKDDAKVIRVTHGR